MIKSLEINNFQSHENTILNFHPGVNVIIGNSCEGKSVILRMFEWMLHNRINGKMFNLSFVSHWAIDDKDKILQPVMGKLTVNDNIIIRKRTDDFNGYIINKKELSAIKFDVPSEINNILNFTNVNLQGQFDDPFLLSKGSGEVARFFNTIIKIDDIDKVLSLVESKKRKSKNDLKYAEDDLKQVNKELNELKYIDDVNILLRKAERIQDKLNEKEEDKNILESLINKKREIESRINEIDIISLKKKFDKLYELNVKIKEKGELFLLLKSLIDKKNNIENRVKQYEKIKKVNIYFKEIEEINNNIEKKEKEKELLERVIRRKNNLIKQIKNNEIEIEKIRKQLPNRCPVCNNLIKDKLL